MLQMNDATVYAADMKVKFLKRNALTVPYCMLLLDNPVRLNLSASKEQMLFWW